MIQLTLLVCALMASLVTVYGFSSEIQSAYLKRDWDNLFLATVLMMANLIALYLIAQFILTTN